MTERRVSVGIVGGGIAGLYCAWKLAQRGHSLTLFECLDRLGGRIETLRFDRLAEAPAECGPMRFELAVQPLFRELAATLGIGFAPFAEVRADEIESPRYRLAQNEQSSLQQRKEAELRAYFASLLTTKELTPEIAGKLNINLSQFTTTLQLLKYGVYRILNPDPSGRQRGLRQVVEPGDDGRPALITAFADQFTDAGGRRDYDVIRTSFVLHPAGQPLHELGFWNALSHVLSSGAVAKIRDLGSFYHLVPENPSASEWTVFWLRLFRSDANLSTIDPGVDTIVDALVQRLRGLPENRPDLFCNATVTKLGPGPSLDRVRLTVDFRDHAGTQQREIDFDHVILALPRWPLRRLAGPFPPRIQDDVEGVIGFPLLKAFLVTDKPWWQNSDEKRIRAQAGAHLIPTREAHYLEGQGSPSGLGMIMLYTDRPATEYWQPYVRLPHERAQLDEPAVLKDALARHVYKALQEFSQPSPPETAPAAQFLGALLPRGATLFDGVLDRFFDEDEQSALEAAAGAFARTLTSYAAELLGMPDEEAEEDIKRGICAFAIRDWSRPPFGAAAHAWAPGVDVLAALNRLKAFSLLGAAGANNVHVCGEAYSDYQGFIEGSLRSAKDVLDVIG